MGRLTAGDVGWVFGVTSKAVGFWQKAGCPRNADGTYNLPEVAAWKVARELSNAAVPIFESGSAMERQREAKARMIELDLEERQGRSIPLEDHKAEVIRVASIFRSSVVTMPAMLAPRLAGMPAREVLARLKGWVHDVCKALAVGDDRGKGDGEP
jgi:hypothetical protein